MARKKLLTNGKAFKRTDDRWGGTVWYMDERGERKRKSFSGTTKAEVTKKMTDYVVAFNDALQESDESRKTLKESMTHWLQVFKFPSVERTTYDRCECTVEHQIFPLLGEKVVGDITAADLKEVLNHWMGEGYAYTTVKKVYIVLNEYFRYLTQQEILAKNPMNSVPMIKKVNFMAAQNKEDLPTQETVTVFTPEEIEKFKAEAFSKFSNGKPKYQQPAAYILMLNTGLRTGELLGLLNSDIDLEHKYLEVRQGVKEVCKRDGVNFEPGREVKVGKTKTATSKRRVPLNQAAVQAVEELRQERFFGPTAPLVSDGKGGYTRPVNFRKRYYRILKAAGIEQKGLHSLRHTFASRAIEQGMDPKTVSVLLGHASVSFTMDTYTHVLNEQKVESMALMEELFNVGQTAAHEETAYPVIATPLASGFAFTAPDFPAIQFECPDIYQGLQDMNERLQEELLVNPCPPEPTLASAIPLQPGQLLLQIPV